MEDVLEVYHRQYRDNEVLVCLDETSKQQVKETRLGRPPRPGAAGTYDYEYERNGVSNLFMLFAPLKGWWRVEVTEPRTRTDWAEVVRKLVDEDYAEKERIVLVMDNLNWDAPTSGTPTGYRIQQRVSWGEWTNLVDDTTTGREYVDTSIEHNTSYPYRIASSTPTGPVGPATPSSPGVPRTRRRRSPTAYGSTSCPTTTSP